MFKDREHLGSEEPPMLVVDVRNAAICVAGVHAHIHLGGALGRPDQAVTAQNRSCLEESAIAEDRNVVPAALNRRRIPRIDRTATNRCPTPPSGSRLHI